MNIAYVTLSFIFNQCFDTKSTMTMGYQRVPTRIYPRLTQIKAIFGVLPYPYQRFTEDYPKSTQDLLRLPNTYPKLTKDLAFTF